MPENTPKTKINAVKGYGAKVTFCEPTQEARERTIARIVEETGATFIHPYNDYRIICGQATCAKELIEHTEKLHYIIAPVSGGGLLSGTALSANYFGSNIRVIAAEPKGADDAYRSLRDNKIYPSINPQTIADGLRTSLCPKTFEIIKKHVSEILTEIFA
ncbi:MAG: pyridoxal-phosphate dependent enzyme [Ignavibacteria bacterium]|jgi:threonine dehydratase